MSSNLAFESKSTWYEAQAERQPAGEPLSGSVETEVCIVGAGLAGLFLAKELTERHRSALILEARRIGAGASGRHGGFCSPGWACRGSEIEERVVLVKAKALFDLSREGYRMVKDVLTTAEVPCTSGILHPSTYSNADGLLRMLERMDKDFGYQLEFLETDTVKGLLDTPKYYQAWRDPKGFHFDALALCLLLGEALQKQGVPIYEETLMKQFNQTLWLGSDDAARNCALQAVGLLLWRLWRKGICQTTNQVFANHDLYRSHPTTWQETQTGYPDAEWHFGWASCWQLLSDC